MKTEAGILRIFELLGLEAPDGERLQRLVNDERSYTQIRDALLDFAKAQGEDFYRQTVESFVRNRFAEEGLDIAAGGESEEERVERIVSSLVGGERQFTEFSSTLDNLGGTGDGGTAPDETLPGILAGGETIRVRTEAGERWYQIYEFPPGSGQFVSYQYSGREQAEAALGDDFQFVNRSESFFNQRVLAEAQAEEVIGLGGNWTSFTEELMRDAATSAGVRDPSLVGAIASDPEMQQIMAQAVAGNWTPEQVRAAQRQTDFWKNTLYPGIENFYNRTTAPEKAWVEYVANVTPELEALGYDRDADGTFNSQVQTLLDRGVSASTVELMTPTFIRARENAAFANVLDTWSRQELGRGIDFSDWFDVVAGEAQPDLMDVVEKARLAYLSQEASAGLADTQIQRLAARTELSDAQAASVFSEFGAAVLALGETGLKRGGLTRDEVLSAMAGINPETGRSIEEVRLQIAKIARENDLFDEEKLQFYTGFTSRGTPMRPGLAALRPEGA